MNSFIEMVLLSYVSINKIMEFLFSLYLGLRIQNLTTHRHCIAMIFWWLFGADSWIFRLKIVYRKVTHNSTLRDRPESYILFWQKMHFHGESVKFGQFLGKSFLQRFAKYLKIVNQEDHWGFFSCDYLFNFFKRKK